MLRPLRPVGADPRGEGAARRRACADRRCITSRAAPRWRAPARPRRPKPSSRRSRRRRRRFRRTPWSAPPTRPRPCSAVAVGDLTARIAEAKGDTAGAIKAFTAAVAAEDRLGYNEPPDWLNPERERLGAVLLQGRPARGRREGVPRRSAQERRQPAVALRAVPEPRRAEEGRRRRGEGRLRQGLGRRRRDAGRRSVRLRASRC